MKKITLLFITLVASAFATQAQTSAIVIRQINGIDTATYLTDHPEILENTTLSLTVDYTNITTNPTFGLNLRSRILDFTTYGTIVGAPNTDTPITTSTSLQTIIFNFVVPMVTADLKVRLQTLGRDSGGTSNIFAYAANGFTIKNDPTLSTDNFKKSKLSNSFYSQSENSIIINDEVTGRFIVSDLSGKTVISGTISPKINVSSLASGLYVLSTKSGVLKFAK